MTFSSLVCLSCCLCIGHTFGFHSDLYPSLPRFNRQGQRESSALSGIWDDFMQSLVRESSSSSSSSSSRRSFSLGPTNEVIDVIDGIRQKRLGGSDIICSELGLGTQRWGSADANAPDKDECFKMMDMAIGNSGVNLIDTAEQYPIPSESFTKPEGSTESIIGEWMQSRGARDQVVVATKVTGGRRVSRRGIIDAVDGSLKRLKTDRIDLLQTHWPARYSPQSNWGQSLQYRREMQGAYGMNFADFDEITQTMGDLVEQGKIRGYGFCNDNAVGLVGCAEAAKRLGVAPPVVLQNDFSILNRRIEENGVAEASAPWLYNAGFFAYNSLAGGVLTGKYLKEPPVWERARPSQQTGAPSGDAVPQSFRRFDDVSWGRTLYRYRSGPADAATRAYAALAASEAAPPDLGAAWRGTDSSSGPRGGSGGGGEEGALAELALRWACSREAVTSVLLGSSSAGQLEQALRVFRLVGEAEEAAVAAGGGGVRGGVEILPDELLWAIDQVHMRNRLPIFSNDDVAAVSRGVGAGGIGEPVP